MGSCERLGRGFTGCAHCVGVGSTGELHSSYMLSSHDFVSCPLQPFSVGGRWWEEGAPCTGGTEGASSFLHSTPGCRVPLLRSCSLVRLLLFLLLWGSRRVRAAKGGSGGNKADRQSRPAAAGRSGRPDVVGYERDRASSAAASLTFVTNQETKRSLGVSTHLCGRSNL